jgi:hypothetical protein
MRFADAGLVLGAGSVLSPAGDTARDISIDISQPRLLALLAAAHLRAATASGLAHIRRAAERWGEGEDHLASMHLALSRLDRLGRPAADAQRLFLADRLLDGGFRAETIIKALDLPLSGGTWKYSPDQPRVPAGSGRTSGEWTADEASAPGATPSSARQAASPPAIRGAVQYDQSTRAASPPQASQQKPRTADPSSAFDPARTAAATSPARTFSVQLPFAIVGAAGPPIFDVSEFSDAVKALADTVEIAESIAKWRELGPKGEAAIREAVQARGWTVLGKQVYVRTSEGLRVEDLMVHIPVGTAGNATAYNGFIEVKVNGGWYSPRQKQKDAIIGSTGGTLLSPVAGYEVGKEIKLETGLANVTITYEPD